MGGRHARDHASVVLVDADQRLEQSHARPRICLPQESGQSARSLSLRLSTAWDAPTKHGAERPGDIGFLAGRREPFGCCPVTIAAGNSLSSTRLILSFLNSETVAGREAPISRLPCCGWLAARRIPISARLP